MLCKFPEKKCFDRYYSQTRSNHFCRLREWKRKKGVCPYDAKIHSLVRINKRIDENQTTLKEE